nr:carboxypeptidase-like regulatory domain-containing protein [Flavobacteriaceae bacterium]
MKRLWITLLLMCGVSALWSQAFIIKGKVLDRQSNAPLGNVAVSVSGTMQNAVTERDGAFAVTVAKKGNYSLFFTKKGYAKKQISAKVASATTQLATIFLQEDLTTESDFLVLSDSEIENDESSADRVSVLLQSSKDVFMRRAAFDFGQVFFKPRGYDSNATVFSLNGIVMNKFQTGRPQWSDWGGLNDVIRNQQLNVGIAPTDYNFGGLLGSTYVDLHPSLNRRGLRLSASGSNRTYKGRLMATYNSGIKSNGLAYTISGSRRWTAHSGYFDGTTYNAFSLYGSAEYQFNDHHSLMATA